MNFEWTITGPHAFDKQRHDLERFDCGTDVSGWIKEKAGSYGGQDHAELVYMAARPGEAPRVAAYAIVLKGDNERSASIKYAATDTLFRGMEFGAAIIHAAVAGLAAGNPGIKEVLVNPLRRTKAADDAEAFYLKLGFKPIEGFLNLKTQLTVFMKESKSRAEPSVRPGFRFAAARPGTGLGSSS